MNTKTSVFVIWVEAIIYLLLYNLHAFKYIGIGDVGRIKNLSASYREHKNLNSVKCNLQK